LASSISPSWQMKREDLSENQIVNMLYFKNFVT
jgi:hypothetical protein